MSLNHTTHLRRWLFSLPPVEYAVQSLRDLLIGSLKCGPIPEHIGFVMDGNRRYARKNQVETVEGHHLGFEALARILEVCYKSGVRVVTIYAFSIENFKRSRYEVDGLMDLARTKLVQMSEHGELLARYGASVRVLGDRSLMREDVLREVDRAVEMTRHNHDAILNVCFPYTGREEIAHSVRETVREYSTPTTQAPPGPFSESHIQRTLLSRALPSVAEDDNDPTSRPFTPPSTNRSTSPSSLSSAALATASSRTSPSPSPKLKPTTQTLPDPETISQETLTSHTYTAGAPPLDLMIRTSGVARLSDFMLWQCHETTEIRFLDCLWPEFDLWQFLPVLVEWQWRQRMLGWVEGKRRRSSLKIL